MPDTVTLIDPQGVSRDVPTDIAQGARAQGWRDPEASDTAQASTQAADTADYGGVHGAIGAIGAGLARGATLGLSDVAARAFAGRDAADTLSGLRSENPVLSTGSEILGAAAPAFISGGAMTPAGMTSKLGRSIVEHATGANAGLAARASIAAQGLAAEGALYGGGDYLSQVALEDKPLSAEGFVGAMGKGALFAVPVGGAFALGGKALQRARSLFPRSEVTAQAARAIDKDATSTLVQSMTDGEQMAKVAERKLSDVDAQVGMAQSGEGVTRRMFGTADPAAMGDQVTGAVDRTQIAKALEDYQASKAQLADWIATEGDPELEAAMRGLRAPEIQGATAGVPVGEFGAPGAPGIRRGADIAPPGELPPIPSTIDETASLKRPKAFPDGTPAPGAQAPLSHDLTSAYDISKTPIRFDPETRNYSNVESGAAEPDLEALLGATKKGLDGGIPMPEIPGEPGQQYRPVRDDDYLAHRKAFEAKLTPGERQAVDVYTSSTYKDINRALRHGEVRNGREGFISQIDAAVAKSPLRDNALLYRGLSGDEAKQFRNLEVGDAFEEKSFTSTSSSPNAFKRDVNLRIDVPAGYEAAPVPSSIDEKEWLLRRNTRFVVTGIEDEGATRSIHVRIVDSPPPRPVDEMVSAKTGRQPDAPPLQVAKSGSTEAAGMAKVAAGADLESLLRGTQEGLAAGKGLSELGAPARAEYATAKAAKTSEAAAHFRAKAVAARDGGGGDLMAALQGTSDQLGAGKGMREIAGAPMVSERVGAVGEAQAPLTPAPSDTTRLRAVIESLHDRKAMPVSAAEYDARRGAMGTEDRPFSAAVKNHTVGKTIVDSSMRGEMARVSDDDAIARLLGKRPGKNVDMGPGLARAARAIGDHEAALAGLADVVGADAPQTVVENAKAYRAAIAEQHELSAASSAKAAADIKNKVQPALDATTVDDKVTQALRQHDARMAARTAPATTAPSSSGGIGSKLATAGAALEVLHALGAHVPSVASIPIIGPILSLFLKAKAVMGIIGRRGGSIGQTAESLIAGKSAITRDRVNAAVGQLLESGAKAARKASAFAVPAAAMLGPKLFPGGEEPKGKDLQSLYHARMDEITRAQAPGAIDSAIGDRIQTGDPALHDAIVAQVQAGVAFLSSKAPKQTVLPGVLPGDGTWSPSRAALEEFAKYVHAVNDPASVLEDLAHGHVTMEGAETLRTVYPKLYAEAQQALLARAPQMQATLSYARRVAISIMFGIPVDTTMSAAHMTFLQSTGPSASMGHSVPATPSPNAPAISGPLQLGPQTMTSLDRRAGA